MRSVHPSPDELLRALKDLSGLKEEVKNISSNIDFISGKLQDNCDRISQLEQLEQSKSSENETSEDKVEEPKINRKKKTIV